MVACTHGQDRARSNGVIADQQPGVCASFAASGRGRASAVEMQSSGADAGPIVSVRPSIAAANA